MEGAAAGSPDQAGHAQVVPFSGISAGAHTFDHSTLQSSITGSVPADAVDRCHTPFVDPIAVSRVDASPRSCTSSTIPDISQPPNIRAEPKSVPGSPLNRQEPGQSIVSNLRRGSLSPNMAAPILHARRGSDPISIELSPITTPRDVPTALRSTEVDPLFRHGAPTKRQNGLEVSTVRDPTKEDIAVAKWRKWAIEIPEQQISPMAHPRRSTSGLAPLSSTATSSSQSGTPTPASPVRRQASPAHSGDSLFNAASRPERGSTSRPSSSRMEVAGAEIYLTDTARALRDVELAVDESALARNTRTPAQQRRMSIKARVSDADNPFVDLASRLGSRRVRPIIVELIQALGHYIDAVWSVRYPHSRCPWVLTTPPMNRPVSSRSASSDNDMWRSRAITAVQEGKAKGYVRDPQNMADVKFWEDEVKYGLVDVDQVVGIYKGVGWAFTTALREGRYGEIISNNVLGKDGSGGNLARLLNDLEDAIWGDAQPRPTDLSFDLPQDFDPYAVVSEEDLTASGTAGGSLAAFLGGGRPSISQPPQPVPEEVYNNANLPELRNDTHSDEAEQPLSGPLEAVRADPFGMEAFKIAGKELSLEEFGKRRHQEWLASRGAAVK